MTSQQQPLEEGTECRVQMISVPATDEEPAHVMVFVEAISMERCQAEIHRLTEAEGVTEAMFDVPRHTPRETWAAHGYVRS